MDTKDPHLTRHSKSLLAMFLTALMTLFAFSGGALAGDSDAEVRKRPHAVLLIGDCEYRSEEFMPMLTRSWLYYAADHVHQNVKPLMIGRAVRGAVAGGEHFGDPQPVAWMHQREQAYGAGRSFSPPLATRRTFTMSRCGACRSRGCSGPWAWRTGFPKALVGDPCKSFSDYRELLEQKDIDAVFIGSPNHWHAMQTIHACEAGKHVYVEKPANCTPVGGRAMVEAARKNKRVVQVGSQGRSGGPTQQVANFVRNGMIGKLHKVTCWHVPNPSGGPRRREDPPANLDWDAWLGPLSMRPYVRDAYHPGRFRWMMESGGGNIRGRGAHMMSTLFWCLGADGQMPVSVEATGDPRPENVIWDIPAKMKVVYKFKDPDWELIWEQPGTIPEGEQPTNEHGKTYGTVFNGDKDEVILFDSGWFSEAPEKVRGYTPPADGIHVYRMDKHGLHVGMNHLEDWLQAIQTGKKPCMDIEIAHQISVLAYLGNMAYVSGRKIEWDAAKEEITGADIDQTLIWNSLRQPYV